MNVAIPTGWIFSEPRYSSLLFITNTRVTILTQNYNIHFITNVPLISSRQYSKYTFQAFSRLTLILGCICTWKNAERFSGIWTVDLSAHRLMLRPLGHRWPTRLGIVHCWGYFVLPWQHPLVFMIKLPLIFTLFENIFYIFKFFSF